METFEVSYPALPRELKPLTLRDAGGAEVASLLDLTARAFGDDLSIVVGLDKGPQGLITNFAHRLAYACRACLADPKAPAARQAALVDELNRVCGVLNALEPDRALLTVDLSDAESVGVRCVRILSHAFEGAMTGVIMDRRKHAKGAPERWDGALENAVRLVLGRAVALDPANFEYLLDGRAHRLEKDEGTVYVGLVNAVLGLAGRLTDYLRHRPVANSLAGRMDARKAGALAKAVSARGFDRVLLEASGAVAEPWVDARPADPREAAAASEWGCFQNRLFWESGHGTRHLARALENANRGRFALSAPSRQGTEVTLRLRDGGFPGGVLVLRARVPHLARVAPGRRTVGCVVLSGDGRERVARPRFVCLNRHAAAMVAAGASAEDAVPETAVRLVSFVDYLAIRIVDAVRALYAEIDALEEHPWDTLAAEARALFLGRKAREFRTMVAALVRDEGRTPGRAEKGEDVYRALDTLGYEATVEVPETEAGAESVTHRSALLQRMAAVIAAHRFPDPLDPSVAHAFSVGATSKGRPLSRVTKLVEQTGRTLVEHAAQPWAYNTDRGRREANGFTMAHVLRSPVHALTADADRALPAMLAQTTDLVVAFANLDGFARDGAHNPDGAYTTLSGRGKLDYAPAPRTVGPLTAARLDSFAAETLGAGATGEDLRRAGWGVAETLLPWGALDRNDTVGRTGEGQLDGANEAVDVSRALYTLTDPTPLPRSGWDKVGFSGHKSVAVPLKERFWAEVTAEHAPEVDLLIDVNTLESKKMEGELVYGLVALLESRLSGGSHWSGTETLAEAQSRLATLLAEAGLGTDRFPLVDADGAVRGECFVGLFRGACLKENEHLATRVKKEGTPRNPWFCALNGEEVTASPRERRILGNIAAFLADEAEPVNPPDPIKPRPRTAIRDEEAPHTEEPLAFEDYPAEGETTMGEELEEVYVEGYFDDVCGDEEDDEWEYLCPDEEEVVTA